MTASQQLVLVTGAAGKVGRVICPVLARHFRLRLLVHSPKPDLPDALVGDIADAALLDRAMAGVDAVVHLAGDARVHADFANLLHANIKGTYQVYEAARRNGVKRIVFASTNHTVEHHSPLLQLPRWKEDELYPTTLPLMPNAPTKPDSFYGVSKVFDEALARYYADAFGVTSVCLRLGSVTPDPDSPYLGTPRAWALWMSERDLAELFRCAIVAEGIGCALVYSCSMNTRRWWDMTHARELIGFTPQDDSETMIASWYKDGIVPPAPPYPLPWGERLAALPMQHNWLVWLGQSGFFLKLANGLKLVVDPFLTEWPDRLRPPLLSAHDLPADLILITHTHRDHLDVHALPIIAQQQPHARFITPPTGQPKLIELGIAAERIITLRPNESYAVNDATITAIPARHQDTAPDAQGYVIRLPNVTLYHTGDTEYDPCLMIARDHHPDILLAPINGRGGNMSGEQVAQLAADLAPAHVIPMHYGCLQKPDQEPDVLLNRFITVLPQTAPNVTPAVMELGSILRLPLTKMHGT
jgi:uronate dehydrogenase